MNVTFRLRFSTRPGQSLWLVGTHPLPGHPVPLQYVDDEFWQVTVPLTTQAAGATLTYSYVLRQTGDAQTTDWGRNRRLVPARFNGAELLVIDSWNQAGFFENAFYTEPFKKVLLAGNFTEIPARTPTEATHTFRVKAPLLVQGQTICLLGEGAALGHWNTQRPVLLSRPNAEDYFSVQLDLHGQPFPFAYKYG
ncbi:MAG TPA: carbohydrate-binding module family 20 domain-containing protein, partial [Candidatus Limnocylindrales bacterium]|nr:carbohydrate-binding module family 20 domain-containing protein [Candidatus Limnocylindrales bacterium]